MHRIFTFFLILFTFHSLNWTAAKTIVDVPLNNGGSVELDVDEWARMAVVVAARQTARLEALRNLSDNGASQIADIHGIAAILADELLRYSDFLRGSTKEQRAHIQKLIPCEQLLDATRARAVHMLLSFKGHVPSENSYTLKARTLAYIENCIDVVADLD